MKNPVIDPRPSALYSIYKVANQLYRWHVPLLPKMIKIFVRVFFAAVLPPETKIGKNVHFAYNGLGIVVHKNCVIGDEVWISHHVTLGGRENGFPTVGNCVYIGAGAKVMGKIRIGDGAKIGANAVVLTDVPDGATAVGIPAKVIKTEK